MEIIEAAVIGYTIIAGLVIVILCWTVIGGRD